MTNASMAGALPAAGKTPWHLWAVGGVSLLWNAYGAYDYVMTKTGGVDYLRKVGFTQAQIDYFLAMPGWMTIFWALGVWGALAGSILLLLRRRYALWAFGASLFGLLVSLVYTYGLSNGGEVMGSTGVIMNSVITLGCVAFVWYARTMTKKGVLR